MPDRNEQSIREIRERLGRTRAQLFAIAHHLKGDEPQLSDEEQPPALTGGFPRSRIMRALVHHKGQLLVGGAAIGLAMWQPRLLRGALRVAPRLLPLVRPVFERYVVPKILGQR